MVVGRCARAIYLTPFKHAEANTDFKSSVLSQGQGASVSEDAASIGTFVTANSSILMFTAPAINMESR